jgi:hypothetical protein
MSRTIPHTTFKAKAKPVSFAIGTVVKYTGNTMFSDGGGVRRVITAVSVGSGELEYAVDGCAWVPHKDLEFLSAPTETTVKIAIKYNEGLDEENDEGEV